MKAWAVVRNNEPLECIEVTTPQPTGTQVVLAVEACGSATPTFTSGKAATISAAARP